ncbi:MAG: hypothetical protein NQU46_05610 [Methanolinea sp.]|nr:hypothetical protein [Methanolinea sp.]
MRSAVFFLLCLFCLVNGTAAYELTINAPAEVRAGAPLEVTGNTTFPAGTQFDLVLYYLQTTMPEIVAQKIIIVDESRSFQASFPTMGLTPGDYKLEVRFPRDPGSRLSSSSVTTRIVRITDRSGEIEITSDRNQVIGDALRIEGYMPKAGVTTLTLKITGPQGRVLPPQDVRTTTRLGKDEGYFSLVIPVGERGNYYVDFSDTKGYITTVRFTVESSPGATPVPSEEVHDHQAEVTVPRSSSIPLPLAGSIGGLLIASGLSYRKVRKMGERTQKKY